MGASTTASTAWWAGVIAAVGTVGVPEPDAVGSGETGGTGSGVARGAVVAIGSTVTTTGTSSPETA